MQKNENFVHCITPTVNVFRITFCFIQPLIGGGGVSGLGKSDSESPIYLYLGV